MSGLSSSRIIKPSQRLSVNVNKIATLRNARGGTVPDLLDGVKQIIAAGAQSITAHPRADRRHITPQDIQDIHTHVTAHNRELDQDSQQHVELNWEGDLREEFLDLVAAYPPTQCTLVPVSYGELTSHRGYPVHQSAYLLRPVLAHLRSLGVRSSVFVDVGDHASIKQLAAMGCDRIEIYTEPYAEAFKQGQGPAQAALAQIAAAAELAITLGMKVNAGHDLNHHNIPGLVKRVPELAELSIGHHLIAYALEVGLAAAVRHYLDVCMGDSVQLT